MILSWESLKYLHFLGTETFLSDSNESPLINPPSFSLQLPFFSYSKISFYFHYTKRGRWERGVEMYISHSKEHLLNNLCLEDTKDTVH